MSLSPGFSCIRKQLEWSKALPIDIQIHLEDYSPDYPSHSIPMVCNTLLTQFDRWRSLVVDVVIFNDMHDILDAISKAHIPISSQLTSIALRCWAFPGDNSSSGRFTLFGSSAPQLKTISLCIGSKSCIDWNQAWITSALNLTTLQIYAECKEDCPSWAEFATILHGAPQLETLIFRNSNGSIDLAWVGQNVESTSRDDSMPVIKLPKLRHLNISSSTAIQVELLRKFYTPALTELRINPRQEGYEALFMQLLGPQAITGTSQLPHVQVQSHIGTGSLLAGIQHLCISHNLFQHGSTECIDLLYSELNQLTSLTLEDIDNPAFIDHLFMPPGQLCNVRLPQLKILSVQNLHLSYLDFRHICGLAWHRKDIGVPLRELSMGSLKGGFPEDCVLWCQENLETFYFTPYLILNAGVWTVL
ncbi:hypothetical protein OG21DRAFT_1482195 [Imleria badia]|nr:hypothetical protein OG21DRAFT_1482195 [Imleria badia]